jgi:hypothetical protein
MEAMPRELKERGIVCKNLFLKSKVPLHDRDSGLYIVTVPEERKVDLKWLSKVLGYKKEIRMADAAILTELMQLKKGRLYGPLSPLPLPSL